MRKKRGCCHTLIREDVEEVGSGHESIGRFCLICIATTRMIGVGYQSKFLRCICHYILHWRHHSWSLSEAQLLRPAARQPTYASHLFQPLMGSTCNLCGVSSAPLRSSLHISAGLKHRAGTGAVLGYGVALSSKLGNVWTTMNGFAPCHFH